MALRDPANRNLWIIAALVLVTAAVLAWFLGGGGGVLRGDVADVSVEAGPSARNAPPGPGLSGALADALSPPAADRAAGGH